MADITNTSAVKFTNEQIRPVCELMRNLYFIEKSMQEDWNNGVNAIIGSSPDDDLIDNRTDVLYQLTAQDISNVMTQVNNFISTMEGAGVLDVITKPCVRPFRG